MSEPLVPAPLHPRVNRGATPQEPRGRVPQMSELVGRRIERVETTAESYFFLTPPAKLRRVLVGRRSDSGSVV